MPKKIRVYELARELGLTNKEALDLCVMLGIGVKSHSSSIEDAQADRARRRADADGLRRDVSPEEPSKDAKPAAEAPSGPSTPGPSDAHPDVDRPGSGSGRDPRLIVSRPTPTPLTEMLDPRPAPAPRPAAAPVPPPRPPAPASPFASAAPPAPPRVAPGPAPAPVPAGPPSVTAPAAAAPSAPPAAPAPAAGQPVTAAGPAAAPPAATGPGSAAAHRPEAGPAGPDAAAPPRPAAGPQGPGDPQGPGGPPAPTSRTGKPIPPPPGRPPTSRTGKPIPPPPGMGGRAAPAGPPARAGGMGGARPSGPGGPPRPGGGAPRPGGFPPRPGGPGGAPGGGGFGARPGGGGPGGGAPGGGFGGRPGGPGGGFGGRPGGPGGRGRPPRRKGGRRRRPLEELEPFDPSKGYAPSNQPVPAGEILVERGSTAQDLGPKLNRSAGDIVRFLFMQGDLTTATSPLSDEAIELFAAEVGATIRLIEPGEEKEAALQKKYFDDDDEDEDEDLLRPRPPIITVMGHVDHGKTKLLDRIRETNVVEGEAGGITQHIGAYQVEKDGRLLTFIDTPGHEAFTAMRARGANVTDIVILVVAADDGVMPQTVEALNHAKAADVPIVGAINKIDREEADPTRVMQQLSELGLTPEAWGGDAIMVELSALQNLGVDDLLEQLLLVAEVQIADELVANPEAKARGAVLEANLDPGQGPVATVMVETGTLRVGDAIVAGAAWGRVRAMLDDKGDRIKEAPPSTPVVVLGFSDVPSAGDDFRVTATDKVARNIAEQREQRFRSADLRKTPSMAGTTAKLEDIFEQIQRGETATLNLILKADVQGSLEAVTESLRKREREEVKLSFVHRAVGGITENDVQLAAASSATIIGFNVRPDRKGRALAEAEDVDIRTYEIIYKLIEDIEAAMIGMLKPEYEEVVTGDAEVREIYSTPRGKVAGCYVLNGSISRNSKVRYLREGLIIWKGSLPSLRRFKEDVKDVAAGFECGIMLSDFQDLRAGDVIETYEEREIPRT